MAASGCKSGPLARLSGRQDTSMASTLPSAVENLDPRVAKLQARGMFDKTGITKQYEAAKAELKDPENVMLKLAAYKQAAAESQGNSSMLEEARQTYSTLLADNPNSLQAMLGLAKVDLSADRMGDAERMYKTVLAKFPNDSEALSAVAGFFNETDRPNEVLKLLPQAIQNNPEDRSLRSQMGVALVKAGQYEAAIPHFTKIGGQANAYATIGQLLASENKTAEAQSYLQRAIDRNPKLEGAKQALAKLGSGTGNVRQAASKQFSQTASELRNAANLSITR
jgi:tetratricopeptide (TPR) repeat protein